MKTNTQFKNEALAALQGNWGKAVLVTLVYFIVIGFIFGPTGYTSSQMQTYMQETGGNRTYSAASLSQMINDPAFQLIQRQNNGATSYSLLLEILLLLPFSLGYANAFRRLLVTGENDLLKNTIKLGTSNYWHKVGGMLVMTLFITLWSMLLLIPGIIKAYSYAMTPYILEENPELSIQGAIHRSREMMHGHKFDLFWLQLSFIGWILLSFLTLGIGLLWLAPYMDTAQAAFYEEVKADYALNGGLY